MSNNLKKDDIVYVKSIRELRQFDSYTVQFHDGQRDKASLVAFAHDIGFKGPNDLFSIDDLVLVRRAPLTRYGRIDAMYPCGKVSDNYEVCWQRYNKDTDTWTIHMVDDNGFNRDSIFVEVDYNGPVKP